MATADESPAPAAAPWPVAAARGRKGFFHADRDDAGRWWLLDPAGAPFYFRGVHGVKLAPPQVDGGLPRDSSAQLRSWGFNAAGVAGEVARDDGLPHLATVDFCGAGPVLVAPGLRLPDVFDPAWPQTAGARARAVCGPQAENPALVGWVNDDALAWAQQAGGGRPTLLQLCLSLEPGCAAYHAAWEFVLALHGGRLESMAGEWGVALGNKEVVREMTRSETGLATRGYLRDHARWTRELARRYFTTTAAAVRAADGNHLLLGCRFRGVAGADVLAKCAYPAVDVAMPDWRELPAASGPGPLQPVLAGEVSWGHEEFLRPVSGGRAARLTAVERMLRRARAALERLARHPGAVGYVWAQWQDEPGEQPPFGRGLIHQNGVEAREHTELLAHFNLRAESLRRQSSPPLSA